MLEFMNTKSCNDYFLKYRVSDCESALSMFNYATPMAVCVEAIIKIIGRNLNLDYENEKQLDDAGFQELFNNVKIRKELSEWGVSQILCDQIIDHIWEISNTYKHSLIDVQRPTELEKRKAFNILYRFLSFYYEHCTGELAPIWKEEEYRKLVSSDSKEYKDRKALLRI